MFLRRLSYCSSWACVVGKRFGVWHNGTTDTMKEWNGLNEEPKYGTKIMRSLDRDWAVVSQQEIVDFMNWFEWLDGCVNQPGLEYKNSNLILNSSILTF
jgi:hypothetical protein